MITIKFVVEKASVPTGDIRRLTVSSADAASYERLLSLARELCGGANAPVVLRYIDEDGDKVTLGTQLELESALRSTTMAGTTRRFIVETGATAAAHVPPTTPAPGPAGGAGFPDFAQGMAPFFQTIAQFAQAAGPWARGAFGDAAAGMFGAMPPFVPAADGTAAATGEGAAAAGGAPETVEAIHLCVQCDKCGALPLRGKRYKCCICADYDLCEACHAIAGVHDASHTFAEIATPVPSRIAAKIVRRTLKGKPPMGRHGPFGCGFGRGGWGGHRGGFGGFGGGRGGFGPWCRGGMMGHHHHMMPQWDAAFLEDVTLEDGTVIEMGKVFTKIWRVRNSGNTSWPEGCVLRFMGGDRMGVPDSVPVSSAAPGATVDVVVEITVSEPGRRVGFFQLSSAHGRLFGPRIWADVTGVPPTEKPVPAAEPMETTPTTAAAEPEVVEMKAPEAIVAKEQEKTPEPAAIDASAIQYGANEEELRILNTLRTMGFQETSLNLGLIRMHKGNLQHILYALLGASQKH